MKKDEQALRELIKDLIPASRVDYTLELLKSTAAEAYDRGFRERTSVRGYSMGFKAGRREGYRQGAIDELKNVQLEHGNYSTQTWIKGKAVTILNRIAELQAQTGKGTNE